LAQIGKLKIDVCASGRRNNRGTKKNHHGDPVISGESGALSSGAQPVKSQKSWPLSAWRSS